MYFDEFKHQLPDIDPDETAEWLASFDQLVEQEGQSRARFLVYKLLKRARQLHVGLPPLTQTRYINTISPEQEPNFPGDEAIELRIRRIIRWNAVAMVLRANSRLSGIGGHLATYASAAASTSRFNHFLRGKDNDHPATKISIRATRRPGLREGIPRGPPDGGSARPFRRETVPCEGLRPHPIRDCCPPSGSTRQSRWASGRSARSTRLVNATPERASARTRPRRGCGPSSVTARPTSPNRSVPSPRGPRGPRHLTFVINCNLQRLDGPSDGNGKIIQELESSFRGAPAETSSR